MIPRKKNLRAYLTGYALLLLSTTGSSALAYDFEGFSFSKSAILASQDVDQITLIESYLRSSGISIVSYSDIIGGYRLKLVSKRSVNLQSLGRGLFDSLGPNKHRLELSVDGAPYVVITRSMVGASVQKEMLSDVTQPSPQNLNEEDFIDFVEVSAKVRVKVRVKDKTLKIAMRAGSAKERTERVVAFARTVAEQAPSDIQIIDVKLQHRGGNVGTYSFVTKHLQRMNAGTISTGEVKASTKMTYGLTDPDDYKTLNALPKLDIAVMADAENQMGEGRFAATDWFVAASASLTFDNGLRLSARARQKVGGNFDDVLVKPQNHTLPVVRSDLQSYLHDQYPMMERMVTEYGKPFGDAVYGQLSVGYFDTQFAGVRAEAVYVPTYDEWSASVDIAVVKKRVAGSALDLGGATTITGHFTLYKEIPGKGVTLSVSAGRYLAGDWGVTSEFKRQFDSGVTLGIYNTKTTASKGFFSRKGDQTGIYLSIPLSIGTKGAAVKPVRFNYSRRLRDAGQKLGGGEALFNEFKTVKDWRMRLGWPNR